MNEIAWIPASSMHLPMPNIASVLKEEIARVARKVSKPDGEALKKQVAQQRSAIAALRRRMDALERVLSRTEKTSRASQQSLVEASGDEGATERHRFSAKGFAKLRQRLALSAAQMGRLLDVSALSVYNWEGGKARPRAAQLAKIASVRGLGKREVAARLGQGEAPDAPGASGAEQVAAKSSRAQVDKPKTAATEQPDKKRRAAGKKTARRAGLGKKASPNKPAAKKASAKRSAGTKTSAKKPVAKKRSDTRASA